MFTCTSNIRPDLLILLLVVAVIVVVVVVDLWSPNNQTSVWFTSRYGVSSSSEFVSCESVTLTNRNSSLLSVWRCMDPCVTDDATVHILLHVCGQMQTLEEYYDSINIVSAMSHGMFRLCHARYDF